ncbi:MAG: hypothetical protein QXE70_10275 [Ignisphaera sp.]
MSIETKQRSVENSPKLREIGEKVVSLLENLRNLVAWWYITYDEDEDNTSTMPYMMHKGNFDSETMITMLEQNMFQRLYYVNTDEPPLTPYDVIEGSIELIDNTNTYHEKLAIYLFKRNNTSFLGVSDTIMHPNSTVFEYPPKSFVSILFYMVNPEIERILRNLSRRYLTSNEYMLNTWESVYDRVIVTKVEKDILNSKKFVHINAVYSSLNVQHSQRYNVLSSVRTYVIDIDEEALQQIFNIELRKAKHILEYYMTNEVEIAYFMKRMLPKPDIITLLDDLNHILPSVRKVPMLIKIIEQLDDEYFKK